MAGAIDDYVSRLERELRARGLVDPRLLAETREHLVDAVEDGGHRGLSVSEAEQAALERFGAPDIVAAHMVAERNDMKSGFGAAVDRVWQRRWWILAPTVFAAILATVASYYLPTRYRAEARMLAVAPRPPVDHTGAVVVNSADAQLQQITARLHSRLRLEKIIEELALYAEERKRAPITKVIERMRKDIRIDMLMWRSGSTLYQPATRLRTQTAESDERVVAFTVSFVSSDPETAMKVTERLAMQLVDEQLSRRAVATEPTNEFVESQIQDVKKRIIEYETTFASLRSQTGDLAISQTELIPYEMLLGRYKALLLRREESRIAANLEQRSIGEQFRILDRARLPDVPLGPSRLQVIVLGALAGVAIGLALVVLRRSSSSVPPTLAQA